MCIIRRYAFVFAAFILGICARNVTAADAPPQLTLDDVQTIFAQAVSRAATTAPSAVVAVTDREGFVLGVWDVAGRLGAVGDPLVEGQFSVVGAAVSEAGTAAFLSSDQNAFTSRTAQFIIQQNFPPGAMNQAPGSLVGVEFSNLPFSDVNRFRRLDKGPNGEKRGQPGAGFVKNSLGTGIPNTRLSGRSSSAPLYKNGMLVGGIGVFSAPTDGLQEILSVELNNAVPGPTAEEEIALAGQSGYRPGSGITADNVTISGIRLPYALGKGRTGRTLPFADLPGRVVKGYSLHASPPPYAFPTQILGGQSVEIRFPVVDDPSLGAINGQARLTADEVAGIIDRASDRARTTRSGIRLPVGSAAQMFIAVVGNPNADGTPAPVLAIAHTPGATMFSFDVALQKARTALFFSTNQMAMSTRTVGFLAQNEYPPGLAGKAPGPLGPEVFRLDNGSAVDLGQQVQKSLPLLPLLPKNVVGNTALFSTAPPNANLPNGITIFPGGFPLYRNGQLVGAVGISGDGVDQDDLVGASACGTALAAPEKIRADQFTYDGARLPYAKFPRNPGL